MHTQTSLPQAPMPVGALLEANPVVGPIKSGSRRYWTNHELKRLDELYPVEGLHGCIAALPGRTAKSIYTTASMRNLIAPGNFKGRAGLPRERWTSSDSIDRLIRQVFERPKKTRRDIKDFAQTIGRPYWWVVKRARKLNFAVPRFKQPPWSRAELDILESNAHRSDDLICRMLKRAGFHRTETAVKVQAKRLRLDRADDNHFTATGLAALLGVDSKTVTDWIARGLIQATRRGTDRVAVQGGDMHWIHKRAVWSFIVENANKVDLRKVDRTWFIDFLAHRPTGAVLREPNAAE